MESSASPPSSPSLPIQDTITFTTAWYDLGAKFAKEQYYVWAQTLLQNVRKFTLVVYVEDETSAQLITQLSGANPLIRIVIFPFCKLPLYGAYSREFEENHQRNRLLLGRVSWKLVLLWCSKQFLVQHTEETVVSNSEYYGWCDLGYFRSRYEKLGELTGNEIREFPDLTKIRALNRGKIHYALVNPFIMNALKGVVLNRGANGLPVVPIPADQVSIAGGFFILSGGDGKARWWREQFEAHLLKYFAGGMVVKDDQYVIIDFIIMNTDMFALWMEPLRNNVDSWFLFQRLLM
jgi:hypothetical protein